MSEKRRILKGTLLGGLLTALVLTGAFGAGFLLGPMALNGAFASTPGQTATTGTTATTSTTTNHQDQQFYANLLEQNLANHFGMDKARINSAFAAAVSDTVAQAVHNGDLSQDQATKLNQAAGQGVGTFVMVVSNGVQSGGNEKPDPNTDELVNVALTAAATRLGMASEADLMAALKQGQQSLAEIAVAHNVPADALKSAMLQAARSHADSNVSSGKWTQAQADDAYGNVSAMVDKMMGARSVTRGGPDWGSELVPAGFHAGGVLIGLSNPDDFGLLVKRDNKSLPQIAQEHSVTVEALTNAMLQAAQAAANQNVSSGNWTQAQADDAFNGFKNLVQKLTLGPLSGTPNQASPPNK